MKLLFFVIIFNLLLHQIKSQRRITNGTSMERGLPKRYMVYLVEAPEQRQDYDAWLCGGTIINPSFILTSAACVNDVKYIYAIAGYEKYVPLEKLREDECTKNTMRKIVFVCVPKEYAIDYEKVEKWSYIDIAAVQVDRPYNFNTSESDKCTWIPNQIEMNFFERHQAPNTDTLILGWGHNMSWRKPNDRSNGNSDVLKYSRTTIVDYNECKEKYKHITELRDNIDKYMICTNGEGNLGYDGSMILNVTEFVEGGCGPDDYPKSPGANDKCKSRLNNFYGFKRRKFSSINETGSPMEHTRRNGICQNDHGGPLITWVGNQEFVIGVASVFLVKAQDNTCVGPYLFTSTYCNGAFLNCILKMIINDTKTNTPPSRRYMTPDMTEEQKIRDDTNERYRMMVLMNSGHCDLPAEERGFDMIERRISWMRHPDGPAQNELPDELIERPQTPLKNLHKV